MFLAALIAGTFLPFMPGSSEVVMAGLLASGNGEPWLLVLSATIGNVLGAIINYVAARYLSGLTDRKWFPITEAQLARSSNYFNRYGVWVLLLTWLPGIGDVITVIAGLLRTPFGIFFLLTALGKFIRYVAIMAGFSFF